MARAAAGSSMPARAATACRSTRASLRRSSDCSGATASALRVAPRSTAADGGRAVLPNDVTGALVGRRFGLALQHRMQCANGRRADYLAAFGEGIERLLLELA